jgi:5'-nucleotidase
MRILLTNDDGVHAAGLKLLERIARELSDDVTVVAPESDQSGVAHSLSLSEPLRLREISPSHFALKGTPTDCVIMGVRKILAGRRPDLVLSGVNRGQNVAEDVTYSGTIAGAMEGALLGIPSIALSQAYGGTGGQALIEWDAAETHAAPVIRRILAAGIAPGGLVNVNFPACPASEIGGIELTRQGCRNAELMRVEERRDGRGFPYYWLMAQRVPFDQKEGTDLAALAAKKISITPLRLDLTDLDSRLRLEQAFAQAAQTERRRVGEGPG